MTKEEKAATVALAAIDHQKAWQSWRDIEAARNGAFDALDRAIAALNEAVALVVDE